MTHPIIAIIFNAPPRCGKDTLGRLIPTYLSGPVRHDAFKGALFDSTFDRLLPEFQEFVPRGWWGSLAYDELKDDELAKLVMEDGFEGTLRQCLIHVSEDIIKPMHGDRYFGEQLAAQLQPGYNIVTDGGFAGELEAVIEKADDVLVIQLERRGYTFSNDSRDYLDPTAHDAFFDRGDITDQIPRESAEALGQSLIEWELEQSQKCYRYHAMREAIPAPYLETFS
jgi:hypothetical protein